MTVAETRALSRKERRAERRTITSAIETNSVAHLVAAAVNVRIKESYTNIRWGGTDWQQEAWLHYDTCPEFHSGVNIGAHNLSRARLIGVEVDPVTNEPGTQPTDDPDVQAIVSMLFGGPSGQGQALAQLYRHLEVAGDCWVLATNRPDLDMLQWEVLATSEVTNAGGSRIMIEQLNGIPRQLDDENELLIRVWQPHPKRRWEADSSARSLLPVLRELAALTAMVSATVKSRLASAGILWIPEEITLPKSVDQANGVTQNRSMGTGQAQGWLDLVTEAMTAPIKDPDSAAAVVPLVAVVKGDWIAKISHMEFGKDLDAMIEPLRESGVKRLAVGMNLPPEILLGLGDVNHWTAWAITEDYARAYLAPPLELVCDALTTFFLRATLKRIGRDPSAYALYFDLSKLVAQQITAENAQLAWAAHELKATSYMAALGFSISDMASDEERARRLILEMFQHANPQVLAEVADTVARLFPGIAIQQITPPGAALGKAVGEAGTSPPPAAPAPTAPNVSAAPKAIGGAPAQTPPPTSTPPGAGGK